MNLPSASHSGGVRYFLAFLLLVMQLPATEVGASLEIANTLYTTSKAANSAPLLAVSQHQRRIRTADAQTQGVGQNISFVERLIQESVAAKQIIGSDNKEASQLRKQALDYLREAKQAREAGNENAVAEALQHAKQAMFKAMRLIGGNVVNNKKQQDFNSRYESVKALLDAHKRVSLEKNVGESAVAVETQADAAMRASLSKFEKGELDEAMVSINSAYLSVKLSLTKMRSGETLVRSLHFATKEDEYNYELDRNETHKMLVNVLLREKLSDTRLAKLIETPMNKADELRNQAIQDAEADDFEAAIKTLEESTQHIIRAIRSAGIYIPG